VFEIYSIHHVMFQFLLSCTSISRKFIVGFELRGRDLSGPEQMKMKFA
jgi:hypothetical protein